MNKLENLRCYLAGPIEYMPKDYNGFDKNELIDFLENLGIKVIDPKKLKFQGVSEISNRDELFKNHDFQEIRRQMKIIVRKDLRAVDISDFIIAFLPKGVKTTGTVHEIIQADSQQKPVLLLCPEGIENIPAWYFGIIPLEYMFSSLDKLKDYLLNIPEYDNHWQFIMENLHLSDTNQ